MSSFTLYCFTPFHFTPCYFTSSSFSSGLCAELCLGLCIDVFDGLHRGVKADCVVVYHILSVGLRCGVYAGFYTVVSALWFLC